LSAKHAFGKGAGVLVTALIVGAAVLGFAAGGHATAKQLRPCPFMCHVYANGTRDIELHWGDHLAGDRIKVWCTYALGAHQQHPHLTCFGPGTKGYDPELVVSWTRGTVTVTRCWNDCASPKTKLLLTAMR
jgi:hypothetical protein